MTAHIPIPRQAVIDFCQRNRIRKLSLFGSVLRDDFRPDSDIDMLVEFEPNTVVGLFDIARMERELSEILGRRVDLRTPNDLSQHFRQQVIDEAEVQYERVG